MGNMQPVITLAWQIDPQYLRNCLQSKECSLSTLSFSLHFLAYQQVSDTCLILCKAGCHWEMLMPARGMASWEKENKTQPLKIELFTDGILSYCCDQIFSHRGNGRLDTLPARSWVTQQTRAEACLWHVLPSPPGPCGPHKRGRPGCSCAHL